MRTIENAEKTPQEKKIQSDADMRLLKTLLPIFNEDELFIVRENMKHWKIREGWLQWVESEE